MTSSTEAHAPADREEQERRLDEMLVDSFPASDPPSSWAGGPQASTERIALHPYATRIEARVAASRLDPSIERRDRLLFEATPADAAASVATAAGAKASLIGGAVTAAVVLIASIVVAIAGTIATTPLGGYATTLAMVSAPFVIALAAFVHTWRRWADRPVELIGVLPQRRRPVFLAVRETGDGYARSMKASSTSRSRS